MATMIFCTVVILFLGVWSSYYTAQTLARNRLAAMSLARSVLEEKMAAGFYACDPAYAGGPQNVSSLTEIKGRPVQCDFVYQFYATDTTPTFRRLTVTVTWTDYAGTKSLTYETHLYRTN